MSYSALLGLTTTHNMTFVNFNTSKCDSKTRDYAVVADPKKYFFNYNFSNIFDFDLITFENSMEHIHPMDMYTTTLSNVDTASKVWLPRPDSGEFASNRVFFFLNRFN